jgi:hypothetical protein
LTYSVLSAAIFSSRRGISTGLVSKSSQPAAIALSRSALIASPILRGSTLIAMMQAANLREGNNVIACRSLASRGEVRQGHQGTCQQPEIVVDKPSVLRHGQSRSDGTQHRAGTAGEVHAIGDGRQRKRRPHRARLKLRARGSNGSRSVSQFAEKPLIRRSRLHRQTVGRNLAKWGAEPPPRERSWRAAAVRHDRRSGRADGARGSRCAGLV